MPLRAFLAEADVLDSLATSISGAWESWITRIFLLVIAAMWLIAVLLLFRGRRVGKRLQRLGKRPDSVTLDQGLRNLGLDTMAGSLREFEEHLVELGKTRHKSVRRYLTEDALQADIRLARWSPLRGVTWRALDEIPSWFVGIGILGTFVGVSLALGALNPEDIAGSIPQTIQGLSTAFWVSIFAVLSSLVLQWATRFVENRLSDGLHAIIERQDGSVASGRPDALGRAQLSAKEQQSELLREQVRVNKQQRRLLRKQNRLADTANATLARIKAETEESRANLQSLLEDLSGRFDKSLNTSFSTFTTHLTTPLENMVTAVKGSAAQAGAVAEEQAKAFTQEAIKHIGSGLQERFDGLGLSIGDFAQKFGHITSQLEDSMSGTRSVVSEQSSLLAATLSTAERLRTEQVTAMEGMSLVPAMVEKLGVLSQEIGASLKQTGGIQERQASLHEQVQVDVNQATAAFSASGAQLAKILATLVPAVETISTSLAELAAQVDAVTNRMDDAESKIGTHADRAQEMIADQVTISQQFVTAFKDGRKVADGFATVGTQMSAAVSQLAATTAPLTVTAKHFAAVADRLETGATSLAQVTSALAGVSDSTVEWAAASTRAVGQFQEGLVRAVDGSLKRYDESLSIAVKDFRAALGDLEERAEQLTADAATITRAVSQASHSSSPPASSSPPSSPPASSSPPSSPPSSTPLATSSPPAAALRPSVPSRSSLPSRPAVVPPTKEGAIVTRPVSGKPEVGS